jgi:4-hydroxy-tetrahydrodipicolinate synthase
MTAAANPASWLAGCIPDLPTPFDDRGEIDLAAFAKICERQVAAGVPAYVVGETAGETSTLTPAERVSLIRAAVEAAQGRVRVIAGAGSNSTSHAIELTRLAEAAGADAILSVVPYYNKPMQSGIEAHFRSIADATSLPIVLHDIPSCTVRALADDTIARLAALRCFAGLRDASADIARVTRLRSLVRHDFRLLSGDEATALGFMASGGDGCISMASNVAPGVCRTIFACGRQDNWQAARALHKRVAPLEALLAREGVPALKAAMNTLGLMRSVLRLPLVELEGAIAREIARAVVAIGERELAA